MSEHSLSTKERLQRALKMAQDRINGQGDYIAELQAIIGKLEANLAVEDEHVRSLVGERHALEAENKRLISANDTLVTRIENLTKDTA